MFILGLTLHAAVQLAGHIRIHEDAERLFIPQNVIGTAANDDAVRLCRHLLKQFVLLGIHIHALLEHGVRHRIKAVPDMNGERSDGLALNDLLHILLRKGRALGDFGDDLLIVIGIAQLFRKAAP